MHLHEKDKQILNFLDGNVRISSTKIAKKLGLSKNAVINRVKKLEEQNIITRYFTLINYRALGYKNHRLYLKFSLRDPNIKKRLREFVKSISAVTYVVEITYDYDVIIDFQEVSSEAFYRHYKQIVSEFSDVIAKKDIAMLLDKYYYHIPFVSEESKPLGHIKAEEELTILTDVQRKLLEAMHLNAKASVIDLAKHTQKKPNSLLYDLKILQEKVIVASRPRFDFKKLGFSHYIVHLNLKSYDEKMFKDIVKAIRVHTGALYVAEMMGFADIEFEVIALNEVELREKLNKLLLDFTQSIAEIKTNLVLSYFAFGTRYEK